MAVFCAGGSYTKFVDPPHAAGNIDFFKVWEVGFGELVFACCRHALPTALLIKDTMGVLTTLVVNELKAGACAEGVAVWILGDGAGYRGFSRAILSYLTRLAHTELINLASLTALSGQVYLISWAAAARA